VTPEILPIEIRLLSLAVLLVFSGWVLRLIRTQRLHLREALIWLLTTIAAVAVTAFPSLLVRGAHLVGVQVPSNALFGAGLLYLAVNVLAVTISVSTNTTSVRRLAQECALLRAEIEALRGAAGRAGGAAPPEAGQAADAVARASGRR
jgi:hypothetical protein